MTKRRKLRPGTPYDHFYCSIDGWRRSYWFEIDRMNWAEITGQDWGSIHESDHLEILGKIRIHHSNHKTRKRVGQKFSLWIHPAHFPRSQWREDLERIGGASTERDAIRASTTLPSDVYFSLVPCLAAGSFKEMKISLLNLRYRHADLDGIAFHPDETKDED